MRKNQCINIKTGEVDNSAPTAWDKYAYFSDNAMAARIPQTKAFIEENKDNGIDIKALREAEEPDTKLSEKGWDKYYFFGCPGDKSKITPAARKGRMRPAAEGPKTFGLPESVLHDDGRKLKVTSYQDYTQEIKRDHYEIKPSIRPDVFPNGHITYNNLFLDERTDNSKLAQYTMMG